MSRALGAWTPTRTVPFSPTRSDSTRRSTPVPASQQPRQLALGADLGKRRARLVRHLGREALFGAEAGGKAVAGRRRGQGRGAVMYDNVVV
jgi:hypothetical protein